MNTGRDNREVKERDRQGQGYIARDEGLATRVAETLVDLIFLAGRDHDEDIPLHRAARAELNGEIVAGRVAPALPL